VKKVMAFCVMLLYTYIKNAKEIYILYSYNGSFIITCKNFFWAISHEVEIISKLLNGRGFMRKMSRYLISCLELHSFRFLFYFLCILRTFII
jgi:hypothetical protein